MWGVGGRAGGWLLGMVSGGLRLRFREGILVGSALFRLVFFLRGGFGRLSWRVLLLRWRGVVLLLRGQRKGQDRQSRREEETGDEGALRHSSILDAGNLGRGGAGLVLW